MIVGAPPLQMRSEVWRLLGRGPGTSCQRCHAMADGQIHAFDKSGIQPSGEAKSLQGDLESGLCSQAHHGRDANELTPPVAFLHLTVDQPRRYLPPAHVPPSATHLEPLTKMSREGIKVHIEAITGEKRQAARSKDLS
jgi:hypothetical protein